jgi:hypothetical protein
MPIYDFTFRPRKPNTAGMTPEPQPLQPQKMPGHPDLQKDTSIMYDPTNLNTPEDVRTVLPVGFHAIDEGILKYFSDIVIPTKDDQRKMKARVAGGDKTFLFWKQDLIANRIQLPVMSINRTGWRWDPMRFSPPYLPMTRKFTNKDGSRAALIYRPWPCLVDYAFSIWGERKRDVEYAQTQIITRFHPFSELRIEFETLKGNIRGKLGEVTDNSDIDIGAEELAKVRYDINATYEAMLPLPEKVVPTILGKVGIFTAFSGEVLDVINFSERGGLDAVSLKDVSVPPIEEANNG